MSDDYSTKFKRLGRPVKKYSSFVTMQRSHQINDVVLLVVDVGTTFNHPLPVF